MNTKTALTEDLESLPFERMTVEETAAVLAANPETGLNKADVQDRLRRFGPNEVPEEKAHPLRIFLKKFWGLTAWMLEFIIVLSWILHRYADIYIVGGLLVVNAIIGFLEERKASRAVDELKTKLQVQARTLRDGNWTLVPARELAPGDILRIRSGDVIPADLKIVDGSAAVDQSALTGESLALEKSAGDFLYAGSVLQRGEATGIVLLTGASTKFGKTTQLVRIARPKLHMEEVVAKLVRWLLIVIGGLLLVTLGLSILRGHPLLEILPLMLVLLLSAIPVALPVMFTVSMAVGARELAAKNVLITRLSATEDAATMDVLCVDKTGTLTLNELAISQIAAAEPFTDEDVIRYGALASQEANHDPLDLAFLKLAKDRGLLDPSYIQTDFTPFDPATRRTEARIRHEGKTFRVIKGAVSVIAQACGLGTQELRALETRIEEAAGKGYKTLAVAADEGSRPILVGWTALSDPPRPDSKPLIGELKNLGISIKMLTGDALPVAREIAGSIGLGDDISRLSDLKALLTSDREAALTQMEESAGFAEVYPEDKFLIVQSLQAAGHVVGMTGDGVNDAPALKQAEVGIAVSSATDIAKASASVVLTGAGLSGIVDLIKNGRKVYQRINTWVLNKIMRTILKSAFVVGVFLVTGDFVISAFAMVLMLLMTDFVKISLSTDRVRWSRSPDTWKIARYVKVSAFLGALSVLESPVLFWIGLRVWNWRPSDPAVQTFSYEILLFAALMSIFVIRERRRFWSSAPSPWLLIIILADMLIGAGIGLLGIPGALPPLPPGAIALVIGYSLVFSLFVNDSAKVWMMKTMGLKN